MATSTGWHAALASGPDEEYGGRPHLRNHERGGIEGEDCPYARQLTRGKDHLAADRRLHGDLDGALGTILDDLNTSTIPRHDS